MEANSLSETAASYNYQLFYLRNAQASSEGKITDFSQVGVKALDERTLEVTLENPTPFFSISAPRLLAAGAHGSHTPIW